MSTTRTNSRVEERNVGTPGRSRASEQSVSIIIPVYNEIQYVRELLNRVILAPLPVGFEKEIIVVDDGSTDGTREVLKSVLDIPNLRVLFHEHNRGKGAAIRTGLQSARGEFVLIQDADLEYDVNDYPALLQPFLAAGTNVVYGVRPDRPERGVLFFLGAKFLTVLTNLLYGCRIHDEATGYKVFRRALLNRIRLKCKRFEFCPEVTAKVCRLGENIYEVPISYDPRPVSTGKKIRWTDGLTAIWNLLRYRFEPRVRFELRAEEGTRGKASDDG